jgi:hypothetical protein
MNSSICIKSLVFKPFAGIKGQACEINGHLLIKRDNGTFQVSGHQKTFKRLNAAVKYLELCVEHSEDLNTSSILLRGGFEAMR